MGQPKHKWIQAEEDALRRGVERYGAGKWKNIHQDPEFAPILSSRSTVDLKDKWRNLSVSSGLISRDKYKAKPKTKNVGASMTATIVPAMPTAETPVPASLASSFLEMLNCHVPNQMKYEPLSVHKLLDDTDYGEAEQVENIKKEIDDQPEEMNSSPPKAVDNELQKVLDLGMGFSTCTLEQASLWAAFMTAEAEERSSIAVESMREAERISAMADETEAVLQFARECLHTSSYVAANALRRNGGH